MIFKYAALPLALLPTFVTAMEENIEQESRYYLGAFASRSSFNVANHQFFNNGNEHIEDQDKAFKVVGGYKLSEHFFVELGYVDFGKYGLKKYDFYRSYEGELKNKVVLDILGKLKGLTLSLASNVAITDGISLYGKTGVLNWTAEFNASMPFYNDDIMLELKPVKESGYDIFAGLGVAYQYEKISFHCEYEYYTFELYSSDDNVSLLSAGLSYHF